MSVIDETYQEEKNRLHEQLTLCQAALADASMKDAQAAANTTRLLRDLETAQDELNSFKTNAASMARAYEEENDRLNAEVMRLTERLTVTSSDMSANNGLMAVLKTENAALKSEKQSLISKVHEMDDLSRQLSTANEREKMIKSELAVALADGQALQVTSDDLVRTKDALDVAQRRCNNLIDELDHSEKACGEKDVTISQLQQQTVQLAVERAALAASRKDVITTNGQLTAAQEERDQLSSMNNDQKQRIDSLIVELQEATNRLASVSSDFNSVKLDADALRLQIINDATRRYMCVYVCVYVCVPISCVRDQYL